MASRPYGAGAPELGGRRLGAESFRLAALAHDRGVGRSLSEERIDESKRSRVRRFVSLRSLNDRVVLFAR